MEDPLEAAVSDEDVNRTSNSSKRTQPQATRPAKRGRYAPRACDACKRRKVRCEGGFPCSRCIVTKKECVFARRWEPPFNHASQDWTASSSPNSHAYLSTRTHGTSPADVNSISGISAQEILGRLISVERQLQQNSQHLPTDKRISSSPETLSAPNPRLILTGDHTQTFVGEISTFNLLSSKDIEANRQHGTNQLRSPTPSPVEQVDFVEDNGPRGWLSDIFASNKVIPDKEEFRGFLNIFFDIVHTLNPFLHRPWIEKTHEDLWQHLSPESDGLDGSYAKRLSIGIVFLCIASGACQESSRMDPEGNLAGYSLYSVAMNVLQPLFDLTQDRPISLESLQALALTSLYLFRVDNSGKAENILSYAISNAHLLGLHRQSTYDKMSVYESQMFCRVWWELHALDRRISVETGRPLLIQDFNVSTRRPLNLSEAWLEGIKSSKATCADMTDAIVEEVSTNPQTCIPYLNAMISYGKVVSDAWKSLYGVSPPPQARRGVDSDYLDVLIETNRSKLPHHLSYDPTQSFEQQFGNRKPWQIQHAYLIHMRYSILRLIIRRAAFNTNVSLAEDEEDTAIQAECASIAAGIITDYLKIPSHHPRHAFPLIHYMTTATMIIVSIILKNPVLKPIYQNTVILSVDALIADCSKSWISGKMMRTISRLAKMVQSGLLRTTDNTILDRTNSIHRTQGDELSPSASQQGATAQMTNYMAPRDGAVGSNTGWLPENSIPASQSLFQSPTSDRTLAPHTGIRNDFPNRTDISSTEVIEAHNSPENLNQGLPRNIFALEGLPDWVFRDFQFEGAIDLYNTIGLTNAGNSQYEGDPTTMGFMTPFPIPPI